MAEYEFKIDYYFNLIIFDLFCITNIKIAIYIRTYIRMYVFMHARVIIFK